MDTMILLFENEFDFILVRHGFEAIPIEKLEDFLWVAISLAL
jgi:hypothetical protein